MHRKTPVLESLSNRVPGLKACNFIKKKLQHRCFPVSVAKFLRSYFYRTPPVAAFERNENVFNLRKDILSRNQQNIAFNAPVYEYTVTALGYTLFIVLH